MFTKEIYTKLISKSVADIKNADIAQLKQVIGATASKDDEVRNYVSSLVRVAHSAGSWDKFNEMMTAYENEQPVKLSAQDLEALKGGAKLASSKRAVSSRSTFGWNPSC